MADTPYEPNRLGRPLEGGNIQEDNFAYFTPSAKEESVPSHNLLHTDEMPFIPSELPIPLPNLNDDDSEEEVDEEETNWALEAKQMKALTPVTPAKGLVPPDEEVKKESPTSVLDLSKDFLSLGIVKDALAREGEEAFHDSAKLISGGSWPSIDFDCGARMSPRSYGGSRSMEISTSPMSPSSRITRPGRAC